MLVVLFGGLLLFQSSSPNTGICDPLSPPNALCQPSSLPLPQMPGGGKVAPFYRLEVLLEDGGRPASRPEIRYAGCDTTVDVSAAVAAVPCQAIVSLRGFRDARKVLNTHGDNIVILSRLGAEGDIFPRNAVRVNQLSGSNAAHRAYAKGEAAAGVEHWAEAEKYFRQAVTAAPSMALAWDELGWALERQNNQRAARDAYEKAIAADPDLVRPYVHLAGLFILDRDWTQAAVLTDRALRLKPVNFPRAHFYNAMAHFNLQEMAEAERSARETIAMGAKAFPLAEYILGVVLLKNKQFAGACEHLDRYVTFEPGGPFATAARQSLVRIRAAVPTCRDGSLGDQYP